MNEKLKSIKRSGIDNNFAIIFAIFALALLTITPILYVKKYMMVLWMLFLLFTFNYFKKADKKIQKEGILGFLFVFLCLLYKIFGVSSADLAYCIVEPFVYFAPIIALGIIDNCENERYLKFLLHSISIAIAINIIDSIRISHEIGLMNLAYQQLAGVLEEQGESGLNLGGTLFVNMIVFYANIMFIAFLKSKKIIEKILFLLYLVVSAYFIIFCSMKASAIFLLLASLLLQYIASKSKRNFGKILLLTIFFVGLIFLLRDYIINLLVFVIDNDRITERLMVFTSTESVSDSNTLMSREDLWLVSLKSWLRDPITFIFGIGDHNWEEFSSTAASGVGNHSDLLDVLARYGLIGGTILYSSIKVYYDYLKKEFGNYFKWEIISFFIILIAMGLTKKFMGGEQAIAIFILLPLCFKYFSGESSIKKITE